MKTYSRTLLSKLAGLINFVAHWRFENAAVTILMASTSAYSQTGTAFRDYSGNGSKDGAGEPGVAGVVVKLYTNATLPSKDQLIGTVTTDAAGAYNFSSPDSGHSANSLEKVRVEF
jgi:hypothetical protein